MYLEIKENKLVLPKCEIEFKYKIYDTILIPDCIVILLDVPDNVKDDTNICAVNFNGKKLWSVQAVCEAYPKITGKSSYVGMKRLENGNISATNWVGMTYEISIKDGKILSSHFTK